MADKTNGNGSSRRNIWMPDWLHEELTTEAAKIALKNKKRMSVSGVIKTACFEYLKKQRGGKILTE